LLAIVPHFSLDSLSLHNEWQFLQFSSIDSNQAFIIDNIEVLESSEWSVIEFHEAIAERESWLDQRLELFGVKKCLLIEVRQLAAFEVLLLFHFSWHARRHSNDDLETLSKSPVNDFQLFWLSEGV